MSFTYLDQTATQEQPSGKFTYLDNSSNKQATEPGNINMTGEEAHGQLQGLKDVGDFFQNPVGSISKALTGKTISESIAGNQQPIPKTAPFSDVLAKNARAGLGDVVENAANLGVYGVGAKLAQGALGIGEAINNVKSGIANSLLKDFAQDSGDLKYNHDARRVMATMPDVIGDDAASTKAAIENKRQETGQAIGETIKNSLKSNAAVGVNEDDVVGHIDDRISQLNKSDPIGNKRTVRALEAKKVALLNNFDENGNPIGPVNFENMTPQQLFDYKQSKLGDIKYTGRPGVDETALNSSLKQSRANITSKMNQAVPELKPLNQDYGDLSSASDAMDKVILKQQREGLNGLGIKQLITAGQNTAENRIKLAQWLYTAPKEAISNLEADVPQVSEVVQDWFGSKSPEAEKFSYFPNLGMAGKVGSEFPISKGGEVPAEIVSNKKVEELPAPAKQMLRPSRALPLPKNAGQSSGPVIQGSPPEPTTPDPNGFLREARNRLGNNEGKTNLKPLIAGSATIGTGIATNKILQNQKKVYEGQTYTGNASTYNWGEKGLKQYLADNTRLEINSPNQIFAAMRHVPMGTIVTVKDLNSGKNIDVPVKDIGPNSKYGLGTSANRVIDLSQGALRKLGYTKPGNINVKVTIKQLGKGKNDKSKY